MIEKTLTLVRGDDWDGIYIDGKLHSEGHSFSDFSLLELGISLPVNTKLETIFPNVDWLEYEGSYPDNLEHVIRQDEAWEPLIEPDLD